MTVHFENNGILVAMLLDLVEVARSHSGLNLAVAFVVVLEEFGASANSGLRNQTLVEL